MKILHIQHMGQWYQISLARRTLGQVIQRHDFRFLMPHKQWVILGFSTHHWHSRITIPLTPDIDARILKGCIVWDNDHGTVRTWGGSYFGKLPRVQAAYITERERP